MQLPPGDAFVFYKLPGENDVCFLSGELKQAVNADGPGFIVRPFDLNEKPLLISGESKIVEPSDYLHEGSLYYSDKIPEDKLKSHYCELVDNGLQTIKKGIFSKVVVSRTKNISLPKGFSAFAFFSEICGAHPDAFAYLFSSPQYGTWLGASPETLLTIKDNAIKTMALAGTVLTGGSFTGKEKMEQQAVTGYIVETLEKYTNNVRIKPTSVKKAGNIEHIITEISAGYNGDLLALLEELHPTPAVGGLPKDKAIGFIKDNEGYSRSLYSGYLGPVNQDKADIFVNLRCMQLFGSEAILYAGAGIVEGSEPEKEWLETENKMNTLLSHIK